MAATIPHRPLAPFGVEVERDLSRPLTPAEADALRGLLVEHGLIVARGQSLSLGRQREIVALFGPLLLRAGEGGTLSTEMAPEMAAAAVSGLAWHADAAYTEHPLDAISLHALDVVDGASSTRFVHAGKAWARLSPALRARLEHAGQDMVSPRFDRLEARSFEHAGKDAMVEGRRPCVIANPRNGEAVLWTSELQTAKVLGLADEDSAALLEATFAELYALEAIYEHRWHRGDLVVWDNVALQHARGNLSKVGRRVLQRAVAGREGAAPHVAAPAGAG